MSLSVNKITNITFTNQTARPKAKTEKENPISKSGERSNLILGTFMAGLGLGARLLVDLFDGDFLGEILFKKGSSRHYNEKLFNDMKKSGLSEKFITENMGIRKNIANRGPQAKKIISGIAAGVGLIGLFICGVAALYTIFKAPKIAYDSKVNSFKKGKDMDVYIKSNRGEKELYAQLNEQAKNATPEEKDQLKEHFMQLSLAKTNLPDFIKK